jgi:translation initiation factor IF-3
MKYGYNNKENNINTEINLRVNDMIRIREVRLVSEDGKQLGIYQTNIAKQMAEELGLDLIEINPNARPPVCKLMDYGKYKFNLQKREKEIKKSQHEIITKNIQFHPNTQLHDYTYRLKQAQEFISKGYRVRASILFRGREINYVNQGRGMIDKMIEDMKTISTVEQFDMENRTMFVIFKPN